MPVIYLDILLALNLFIDFLLLTATAAWRKLPHRRLRLILAAIAGAGSACVVLLPALPWWGQILFDVVTAAVMVRIAFAWHGWAAFGKTLAALYLLSAGLSGICTLIWQLFAPTGFRVINGTVYYDVPPITLVILTVVSYGALTLFERLARPKLLGRHVYRLAAEINGQTVAITALYDSGNLLTEPFSGSPVIAVERAALGGWQPPSDPEAAAAEGFRMLPYRTASGEGLWPAFKPKRLTVQVAARPPQDITGVYLAAVDRLGHGEYQAVIGDPIITLLHERTETV